MSHLTSCFLDLPEQAPGAKIGTPKSSANSTNTDVIIGGVVGGVTIISLVVAIGFFLQRRRRQRAASVAPPVVGASQPPMDEIQQPSTMDYEYTGSYITGTNGSSSMPGTHLTPMTNVRVFRAQLAVAFLRLLIACGFLPIYFSP